MKKIISVVLVAILAMCAFSSCAKTNDLPNYEQQEFEICGLWAPHEITETAFQQYKDAGFNVLSFTNHD